MCVRACACVFDSVYARLSVVSFSRHAETDHENRKIRRAYIQDVKKSLKTTQPTTNLSHSLDVHRSHTQVTRGLLSFPQENHRHCSH